MLETLCVLLAIGLAIAISVIVAMNLETKEFQKRAWEAESAYYREVRMHKCADKLRRDAEEELKKANAIIETIKIALSDEGE